MDISKIKTGDRILNIKDTTARQKCTSITYSDLVQLRNNSLLTPGQWYRITNYVTTTVQEDTQSAGHAFDILVMAEDTNVLSENALAALHDGDTYFANSNINAWELKYCLDNDTNRFAWATTNGGKGVIYFMRDEYDNECPYDFKNVMFARYLITSMPSVLSLVNTYSGFKDIGSTGSPKYPSGATINNTAVYRYTFDYLMGTTSHDLTIYQQSQARVVCHGNIIAPWFVDGQKKRLLNNITIGGNVFAYCYKNVFDENCRNNSIYCESCSNRFGTNTYCNSIKDGCISNSIGDHFRFNSIGGYFNFNSIGSCFDHNLIGISFGYNSIQNYFSGNYIRDGFTSNSIGDRFTSNSIGNNFNSNSIGGYFANNFIGNYFLYNSIGNGVNYNSVGNSFVLNSVGNRFCHNSVGTYVYYNSIGDKTYYCEFGDNIYGANLSNGSVCVDLSLGCEFNYDCGSWDEYEDEETGDTGVCGVDGAYVEMQFFGEQEVSGHVKVFAHHAGGFVTLVDNDFTTDGDGTFGYDALSASWPACDGDECFIVYEVTWMNGTTKMHWFEVDNW